MDLKKYIQKNIAFLVLAVIGISSMFLFFSEFGVNNKAKIIFLDVGQGDSMLITAPNGRQILIDSGKYADITMKLAKYMSASDRSLDMLIATHPDIDHVAGFDAVLDEYNVDYFIHSGLSAGASVYRTIAKKVRENNLIARAAVAGEKIFIDKDMYLEVLSPYLGQKIVEPNDYSIVLRLVYGDSSIILTGDASKIVERDLVSMYGDLLKSDILKLGHHGSKTSTDNNFVKKVEPDYGIISAGCDNSYGHPHASILRILDENNIEELSTCEEGDIVFELEDDGWVLKNK